LRTAAINVSLQRRISIPRLAKYLTAEGNNLDAALGVYELNTRLAEAFYPALQCLEVCLRNTLYEEMKAAYGAHWFTAPAVPLNDLSKKMVADARAELSKSGDPNSDDDMVAELKFAFWVGLLGPGYDATLWRRALHRGFQAGGKKKRTLVHGRLNAIRRFRNRIAHHEPVFERNTMHDHGEIMEAIGWMCADTAAWAAHNSRVQAVFQAGVGS
jgi:hypothetical protein